MVREAAERNPTEKMSGIFPDGVMVDILKRVSVKDMVRFTTVAKSWYTLITSKYFISLHTQHEIARKNDLLLVRTYTHNTQKENYSVRVDSDGFGEVKLFDFPFESRNAYFLKVIGCVNGVVCLSDDLIDLGRLTQTGQVDSGPNIILWNPSIMKSVTLPSPNWLETDHVNVGFGFDSVKNDYKVVRVCPPGYESEEEGVEVYELGTGSWRIVECGGFDDYVDGNCRPVYLNGVVHWMGESYEMIVSFDMASEVCGSIDVPNSLVEELSYFNSTMAVFQERLALVHLSSKDGKYSVWVLEEYGNPNSWTQRFNFDRPQRLGGAFGFLKSGDFMLVETTGSEYAQFPDTKLVCYSPESNQVKDLGVLGSGANFFVGDFVETIELLGIKGQSTNHANIKAESSSKETTKAGSEHQSDEGGKSGKQAKNEAGSEVEVERDGKSAKQAKIEEAESGSGSNDKTVAEWEDQTNEGKSAKSEEAESVSKERTVAESEDHTDDDGGKSAKHAKVDAKSSSESEDEAAVDEGKSAECAKCP